MQDLTLDTKSAIAMQNPQDKSPDKIEDKSKPHKIDQSVRLPPAIKEAIDLTVECLELDKSEIIRASIMTGLPKLLDLAIKTVQLRSLLEEEKARQSKARLEEAVYKKLQEMDLWDLQQIANKVGIDSDRLAKAVIEQQTLKEQRGANEPCNSTH